MSLPILLPSGTFPPQRKKFFFFLEKVEIATNRGNYTTPNNFIKTKKGVEEEVCFSEIFFFFLSLISLEMHVDSYTRMLSRRR